MPPTVVRRALTKVLELILYWTVPLKPMLQVFFVAEAITQCRKGKLFSYDRSASLFLSLDTTLLEKY